MSEFKGEGSPESDPGLSLLQKEREKFEKVVSESEEKDVVTDWAESLGHIFFSVGVLEFKNKGSDYWKSIDDPPLPEKLLSGEIARKHVWGRTDLGDYRNKIKNINGVPVGVTVHVKRVICDGFRQANVLTLEDVGGECEVVNIVTTSGKKLTVNVGRLPASGEGEITTNKLELT